MSEIVGNLFDAQDQEGFVTHRSGQIARGNGPPNDVTDYVAGVYIDAVNEHKLYLKRKPTGSIGTWGNWVYKVPVAIATTTKWFGDERPTDDLGEAGDHFLLWDCNNASIEPTVFGPKANGTWPENGEGLEICPAGGEFTTFLPVGATDETTALTLAVDEDFTFIGAVDEAPWEPLHLLCFTPIGAFTWGYPLGATINDCWDIDPSIEAGQGARVAIGVLTEEPL